MEVAKAEEEKAAEEKEASLEEVVKAVETAAEVTAVSLEAVTAVPMAVALTAATRVGPMGRVTVEAEVSKATAGKKPVGSNPAR